MSSKNSSHSQSSSNFVALTFSKSITPQSSWADKDEFLDVIYWLKQIVGVILGLIWGAAPFKGFLAIVVFLAITTAIVYLYSSLFQHIDEDEFGGYGEILKEGFMTAFASFLVVWIVVYDSIHGSSVLLKY